MSASKSRPVAARRGGRKGKVESGSSIKVGATSPSAEQELVADAESFTAKSKSSASKKVEPASQDGPNSSSTSGRGRKRGIKVEADENEGSSSEKRQHSTFSQASTVSTSGRRSLGRSTGSRRSEVTASPSLRAAPSCKHAVMFTGFISESDSALVRDLGGVLTEELAECTVGFFFFDGTIFFLTGACGRLYEEDGQAALHGGQYYPFTFPFYHSCIIDCNSRRAEECLLLLLLLFLFRYPK